MKLHSDPPSPTHPSVDLRKRLPQRTDCGTASFSTDLTISPHSGIQETRLQHFLKGNANPAFILQFCFSLWMNLNKTCPKKNNSRHKYEVPQCVCKSMPSIMLYTGLKWWTTTSQHVTGPRTLWKMIWEMLNIFSFPVLSFSNYKNKVSICDVDIAHLK